jgi:Na+-translocating ferredoxin:NAD+ oxidoreductase subunit D
MEVHTSHLIVSPVPHVRASLTTRRVMGNVIIALMPSLLASVLIFGLRALLVTAVTVAACVAMEGLWCILRHEKQTIGDLSAVVTGLLLAFNLPSTVPLYLPVIGAAAAILVTKQLFGGIGHNFANPAIVGRIALAVSFPSLMTAYTYPTTISGADVLSSATPLATHSQSLPLLDLFLGTHGGVLGETCALALIIGFVWLLVTRTVELTIPLAYLGTVTVMSLLCGQSVPVQLLSGGLLLGAFFMATDYTTSPFTRKGKLIFGIGCGVITCAIRFWGNMNEGVSYSILLMNLTVPYINAKTRKVPMGGAKKK